MVARFSDRMGEHLQKLTKTMPPYLVEVICLSPTSFQLGEGQKWWARYWEIAAGWGFAWERHRIAALHSQPEAMVLAVTSMS